MVYVSNADFEEDLPHFYKKAQKKPGNPRQPNLIHGGLGMKNDYEIRGEVTAIFIKRRNGQVLETLIDTEDLDKLKKINCSWCVTPTRNPGMYYVFNYKKYYLHRVIMDAPDGLVVDHIHHNTLDNRKSKLRVVTNATNLLNHPKNLFTPFDQGSICWHKRDKKWRVRVTENGKRIWLGQFKSLTEAENKLEDYIQKVK
jgi:hypothetical protein